MRIVYFIAMIFSVVSCTSNDNQIQSQVWDGTLIRVETRPEPVTHGMNEFLVIATDLKGKIASDMVVSIRMDDTDGWRQSIQDGHSGVYRRAINVRDMKDPVLHIQLRRGDKTTILDFPLQENKTDKNKGPE